MSFDRRMSWYYSRNPLSVVSLILINLRLVFVSCTIQNNFKKLLYTETHFFIFLFAGFYTSYDSPENILFLQMEIYI